MSRLVAAALSILMASALARSLGAQGGPLPPLQDWLPLRADEVIDDAATGLVILRGRIDQPGGRTQTSVVIDCSRNGRYLAFTDFAAKTDDRYGIDAAVCDALARVPRRGEP